MSVEIFENKESENVLDMTISESAANKIKELLEDETAPNLMLRVFITGGGCSGFSYGFTFEDNPGEEDSILTMHGISVVVDFMSYQYLVGAKIDLKDELMTTSFVIENPNAKTTCGCGSSFSV